MISALPGHQRSECFFFGQNGQNAFFLVRMVRMLFFGQNGQNAFFGQNGDQI